MYFHLKEYSSEEKCYVSIPYVPIQTFQRGRQQHGMVVLRTP